MPARLLILAAIVLVALAWSAIEPYDRATWWMEVAPVLIAAPILVATHRRFPLTSLLYVLIAAHALVLILGGAYTYARVPLGFWLQDLFQLGRNPYDKIGHFMQGLVPTLVAREILVRGGRVAQAESSGRASGNVRSDEAQRQQGPSPRQGSVPSTRSTSHSTLLSLVIGVRGPARLSTPEDRSPGTSPLKLPRR